MRASQPPQPSSVGWPVRAAFYYPWFPETERWSTRYTPSLGKYDSSDPHVVATHVAQARYAGLNAFISSYWGKDSPTARRLPLLLDAAGRQGFRIAAYYELGSLPTQSSLSILGPEFDALYQLSAHPAWLRVTERPVLFVYNVRTRRLLLHREPTNCSKSGPLLSQPQGLSGIPRVSDTA